MALAEQILTEIQKFFDSVLGGNPWHIVFAYLLGYIPLRILSLFSEENKRKWGALEDLDKLAVVIAYGAPGYFSIYMVLVMVQSSKGLLQASPFTLLTVWMCFTTAYLVLTFFLGYITLFKKVVSTFVGLGPAVLAGALYLSSLFNWIALLLLSPYVFLGLAFPRKYRSLNRLNLLIAVYTYFLGTSHVFLTNTVFITDQPQPLILLGMPSILYIISELARRLFGD